MLKLLHVLWMHPRLPALLSGIGLALGHTFSQVPPWADWLFFGAFVALFGIPHGALDHLISAQLATARRASFSMVRFLSSYFFQMLVYGLLWWLAPAVSLWLFLLLSAWHFGESDLQPAPQHLLWMAAQLLLGGLVLYYILMRQPALTADIILRITRGHRASVSAWQWLAEHQATVYLGLLSGIGLLAFPAHSIAPLPSGAGKWGYWFLLMATLYFLPVLPAFALYFGGWHALNTFRHMAAALGGHQSVWRLWKAAIPFTLLALLFLLLVGLGWYLQYSHLDPVPMLFVFIAIITLPHLVVMSQMFRQAHASARQAAE